MHGKLVIPLLFLNSLLSAQTNPDDSTRNRFITDVGIPFGTISSATIGNKGGKLISTDGLLELIIPAGALLENTNISIQTANNTITGDKQGTYNLEPSGIQFKKAVQLIFHYNGNADEAELKGIATQDKNGLWWQLRKVEADTIAKTIAGHVLHFSHWQLFEKLVLKPRNGSVKINGSLTLSVYEYSPDEDLLEELKKKKNSNYSEDGDLLAPLVQRSYSTDAGNLPTLKKTTDHEMLQPLKPDYKVIEWSVNGIENGNSEVGTIVEKMKLAATYKAPAKLPSQNPVAVTAKIQGISYKAGKQRIRNLYLTSSIKIIGQGYFVTFRGYSKGREIFSDDESSFLLTPSANGFVISDVTNHPVKHTVPPKAGGAPGCVMTLHDLENWKGPVQIGTVKQTFVKPATKENPFTRYDVMFNNPLTAYIPAYTITCRGVIRNMPAFMMAGIPNVISFEVNGDEINIIWNEKRYGSYYKSPDQNGWFEMSIKKH